MTRLAQRLLRAILAAGVPIRDVRIPDVTVRATWLVDPTTLQPAAQPTIDAFNPDDPSLVTAELDAQVRASVDEDRLISAVVWTIIDTYSAPATRAKYLNARSTIIDAYKAQPWKA